MLGRRRMSDFALARKIGRSRTYIYRRLIGETAFDVDDLGLIAEALDVNIVDLLPRSQRATTQYLPGVTTPPVQRVASTPVPAIAARLSSPLLPRRPPATPGRTALTTAGERAVTQSAAAALV